MQLPAIQSNSTANLIGRFDRLPSLSKEEEYELALRLKEHGDVDAAQRLITANLRNVVRIAMDYSGYGLPLEDIVQEGTIGLMIAVKKFDPNKGYRLMTYAVWWVKAMIHDYILRFFSQVKLGTTKLQKRLFYGLNRMSAEEEGAKTKTYCKPATVGVFHQAIRVIESIPQKSGPTYLRIRKTPLIPDRADGHGRPVFSKHRRSGWEQ